MLELASDTVKTAIYTLGKKKQHGSDGLSVRFMRMLPLEALNELAQILRLMDRWLLLPLTILLNI